jgi:hypothetical protein
VLWAVQNDMVPHLKGIPAIGESGEIHPAYTRAVGAGQGGYNSIPQNDGVNLALIYPKNVIDNVRSVAGQNGYDTSRLTDEEIDRCIRSIPDKDKARIQDIYNRLPDEGKTLNDQERQDMLQNSRELREEIKQQLDASACKPKLDDEPQ